MCQMCIGITGGTGTPPNLPYIRSGAVSGDNIGYSHVIEFCKPSAGVWFNENDEPPRYSCGDFTRNLDAYPLNDATLYDSITGNYKFGYSEMVLIYARLENYPRSGGYVKFDFKNPTGQTFYTFQTGLPLPDPSWDWWYAWAWGVVGHFDNTSGFSANEIIAPGNYRTIVSTPWGSANVDYLVTGTPPISDPTISSVQGTVSGNSINVTWTQDAEGEVTVLLNSVPVQAGIYPAGINHYTFDNLTPALYNICVAALNQLCVDVRIEAPVQDRIISSLYLEYLGNHEIFVQWNQAGAGNVYVIVNGLGDIFTGHDSTNTYTITAMQPGTHTVCVEGTNKLCASVTVTGPALCGNLAVDTWRPEKTKAELNENISFTFRSKDPNKSFRLFYATLTGFENLINATTGSDGCYTGSLPSQPEGRYDVKACYDIAGYCTTNLTGAISLTWGNPPITNWMEYIPYAIGAYLIANIFGGRR